MPLRVTLHASTTCPSNVDFATFRCYLAGYSVEETVEHLLTLRGSASGGANPPVPGTPSISGSLSTPALQDPASFSQTTGAVGSHAGQPLSPVRTPLQKEDSRLCRLDEEEALSAGLSSAAGATAATGPLQTASEAVSGSSRQSSKLLGERPLPLDATLDATLAPHESGALVEPADTAAADNRRTKKDREKKKHRSRAQSGAVDAGGASGTLEGAGTAATPSASRGKRRGSNGAENGHANAAGKASSPHHTHHRARRQSFFLNDDFLYFQHRLVQMDGGPVVDAPLRSNFLFHETEEQYRLYELLLLEELLQKPYAFLSKQYLPMRERDRRQLVELYYECDTDVFRYFFGDKMQKFEPIDNAERNGIGRRGHGASGDSASSLAASPPTGGSVVGSMVGSVLFGWAMRSSHNEDAIAHLLHLSTASLRRQWENIKHVSNTMVNMYLAKSDIAVPYGVSLLEAIQQSFAIRGNLAVNYTTAVFGYHHRLTAKLLECFKSFDGYITLCNVIASQWCDQSLLLLDECFIDRCRRIGKLLDENRVLAELHLLLFGEVMRPRWQVQLDEVQRAITTTSATSAAEKNSASAVEAAAALTGMISPMYSPASSGGNGHGYAQGSLSPVAAAAAARAAAIGNGAAGDAPAGHEPLGTSADLTAPAGSPHRDGEVAGVRPSTPQSPLVGSPVSSRPLSPRPMHAVPPSVQVSSAAATAHPLAHSTADAGLVHGDGTDAGDTVRGVFNGNGSGLGTVSASNTSGLSSTATATPAAAGASAHGLHSANKRYTRRFMLEFPYLLRWLMRIATQLGTSASINDAMETFYTRVYVYLESMSARSAPAAASMVLSSAAAAAAAVGAPGPPSPKRGTRTPSSPLAATLGGGPFLAMSRSTPQLLGGTAAAQDAVVTPASLNASGKTMPPSSVETTARALAKANSAPNLCAAGSNGTDRAPPAGGVDAASPTLPAISPTPPPVPVTVSPVTTVVNSSMAHPVATVLPLSALVAASAAAIGSAPTSSPLLPRVLMSNSFVSPGTYDDGCAGGGPFVDGAATAGGDEHAAAAAFSPSQFGDVVMKALDKRYLRELSMLLTALPTAWSQAHSLSAEDHATCDSAFSDFLMAFKAITQILMAADDF